MSLNPLLVWSGCGLRAVGRGRALQGCANPPSTVSVAAVESLCRQFAAAATMIRAIKAAMQRRPTTEAAPAVLWIFVIPLPLARETKWLAVSAWRPSQTSASDGRVPTRPWPLGLQPRYRFSAPHRSASNATLAISSCSMTARRALRRGCGRARSARDAPRSRGPRE